MTKLVTSETGGSIDSFSLTIPIKSGTTVAIGDLIGFSAGWVGADADAQIPAVFMACEAGTSIPVRVTRRGILTDDAVPYTAGDDQYLSATVKEHTATMPVTSTTLTILQKIGVALDTARVAFDLTQKGPVIMRIQAAVDPASADTDVVANLAVTTTGVLSTDQATLFSAPAVVQGVIYNGSLVCTANTVTMGIANASAGTVNGASTDVIFLISRY